MHRFARPLALCCSIALLGGCHRHDDSAAAKTVAAPRAAPAKAQSSRPAVTHLAATPAHAISAAKPAATADAFRVTALTLGTAIDSGYAVTAPATSFSADIHTLYASVATTGHTTSARLGARWRYLEGQGMVFNDLSQTVATDGPAVTTFEVQNPNRWPTGNYVVEISLDGKQVAQQAFAVTDGK